MAHQQDDLELLIEGLRNKAEVIGMKTSAHLKMLVRRGLTSKANLYMQRLWDFMNVLLSEIKVDLDSCDSPNLGDLFVLPQEALHLVVNKLRGRDVRGISRAFRSAFDSVKTRLDLCLHAPVGEKEGDPPYIDTTYHYVPEPLVDLVCCSPQITDVKVPRVAGWEFVSPRTVLPRILQFMPRIQKLYFGGLYNADAIYVAPALQGLPDLRDLTLVFYINCAKGAASLSSALRGLTSLNKLHISSIAPSPACGVASFFPALQVLSSLQELSLDHNPLGPGGAASLAPVIQELTGLQELLLGNNKLGAAGATSLAPALKGLTGLQILDLDENELGAEGALSLAPSLIGLTSLQELYLSSNSFGAVEAEVLAPALKNLKLLRILDLA